MARSAPVQVLAEAPEAAPSAPSAMRRRQIREGAIELVITLVALTGIAAVVLIFVFVAREALPLFRSPEVAKEVDSVFCIDAFTVVGPGLKIPEEVLESIRAEGFTWRPNAKINMGLGRAWE